MVARLERCEVETVQRRCRTVKTTGDGPAKEKSNDEIDE